MIELLLGSIVSVILGLGFGSYSTMAAYRLPRGENWIGLKPRCLHCEHVLTLRDFFPVISWFKRHGMCRYCGKAIECKSLYLFIEIATTVASLLCFLAYGFSEVYLLMMGLSITLIILMATDIEHRILPAKPLLVLVILGSMYRVLMDGSIYELIMGATLASILAIGMRSAYFYAKKQPEIANDYARYGRHDRFGGPGFSYVKLITIMGLWLGIVPFLQTFTVAGLLTLAMMGIGKLRGYHGSYPLAVPLACAMLFYVLIIPIIT